MVTALIIAGVCVLGVFVLLTALHFGWLPALKVGSGESKVANDLATGRLGPFVALGMLYVLLIGMVVALLAAGAIGVVKLIARLL